ncbi:retrovirus-related pol polyprotein from transposon TNT 1-94 [Tanacetum coccineum]
MHVLPDDQMNSVINSLTAKSTWDDLILYHEGPSNVKENRVMDLKLCYNTFKFKEGESLIQTFTRYKALMNELVNNGIKLSKLEINTSFINGLPKKWLAFCQSLINTNYVKEYKLASLFGKLKYEENLINNIYDTNKETNLVPATPLSTASFSTSIFQDFQDSLDDEEDTRSSQEYMNDLEEEYQARALLAKSKRFFKKGTQRFSSEKATDQTECHKCGKKGHFTRDCKNKGLITETYDWDEEEVSSDDNEVTKVKALMDLADEERVSVGKESARNGEWIKIFMKKVHTLLKMEDNDDRKSFLDYLCIDLSYVEEQRKNLMSKHRNLIQEVNTCKEQLLVLKQAKLDLLTMQHCISEQIPTQKKKILGIDQLTEDTFSSGPKDLIFVKSSAYNVSITDSNLPRLFKAENSTLSNHDTGKIPSVESQRNTNDPLVAVTESSSTNYDSTDESSVCSTPLPPLKKLDGAELVYGPKTIKSILKSKSTFKAEALKCIIINEPSAAHARGNKSSSASKTNPALAGKLKIVKMEDGPSLAIVMKELNELKLQIIKKKSSHFRNKNTQQVPHNALKKNTKLNSR